MTLPEALNVVIEAESTLRHADQVAEGMAQLLRGRLRHVSGPVLVALKHELTAYNAHTMEWDATETEG